MTDQELICDARDHIANRYDMDYKLLIRCFEAVVDRFSALQAEIAQQNNSNEVLRAERDELHSNNCKLRTALSRVEAERDAARQDCAVAEENHRRAEVERKAAVSRQEELDDALRDMVLQYCSHDGKLDHEFMSAGEHAFDVLDLDYGAPIETLWRGAQWEG